MNPEKTNDFEYVSGQNILDIHSTCDEMLATRTMANTLKNKPQKMKGSAIILYNLFLLMII
uniref:hypothetical protein n=1 Tax=Lactococcus sp. TaxID=44273 RepID=UPI0034DD06CE